MKEHLDTVLSEMFKRVDDEYSPEKCQKNRWWMNNSWTQEDENSFIDWLTNYLYNNKKARLELMMFTAKNKKNCRKAAQWFCFMYGWTYIKNDIQSNKK